MKLISYNVNGLRAASGKGLLDWLQTENPDIFCLNETKAQPDQLDLSGFTALGYHAELNSAEKKGYSGVAVFSKQKPNLVTRGMGNPVFDSEGRILRCDFGDLTVVSVYVPSGSSGEERQAFKMAFLDAFYQYLHTLKQSRTRVLVCGDFNICHRPIDINHPERQIGVSGFLPEERAWMDQLQQDGWVDTFREFCTDAERYSWWSYRGGARFRNAGWRIDYFWASEALKDSLQSADILDQVVHSDHCPIKLMLK